MLTKLENFESNISITALIYTSQDYTRITLFHEYSKKLKLK